VAATLTGAPAPARMGHVPIRIFLLRDQRLEPVSRMSRDASQDAIDQLAAGATRGEAAAGLRSALPPQTLVVTLDPSRAGLCMISVPAEFSALSGREQLLAVAQMVWTVTERPDVDRVQLLAGDRPIAAPTEDGLTSAPLTRQDFASIAPT
jgi:spore germination protein GerM